MQELVLILSSLAGVAVAATVRRIPKTKSSPSSPAINSLVKDQITSLKIEKDLLHKTIARLYTTDSDTVKAQKDRLLSKYQYQLEVVSEKLDKIEQAKNHPDFGLIGESLSTLMDQKLSKLDDRLHELSSKIQTSKNEHQKITQNISKQSDNSKNNLNKISKQKELNQTQGSSTNSEPLSKPDGVTPKILTKKLDTAATQQETKPITEPTLQLKNTTQADSDKLADTSKITASSNIGALPTVGLGQTKKTPSVEKNTQKQATLSSTEDEIQMMTTPSPVPTTIPPKPGVLPKVTPSTTTIPPKPGVLPKVTPSTTTIPPKPGVLPKVTPSTTTIPPKPGVLPKVTPSTTTIPPKPGVLPKVTPSTTTIPSPVPTAMPKPNILPKNTPSKTTLPEPKTFPDLEKISQKPVTPSEHSENAATDDEFDDADADDLDVIKKDIAKILTKLDQAEVE